jgi:hypothetical protein
VGHIRGVDHLDWQCVDKGGGRLGMGFDPAWKEAARRDT